MRSVALGHLTWVATLRTTSPEHFAKIESSARGRRSETRSRMGIDALDGGAAIRRAAGR